MIYLLSGPPGAGKGTQSDLLVQRMQFKKLSTGDALRSATKAGTRVGRQAETIMARGELVPDPVLFVIVQEALSGFGRTRVVLDGYPRTTQQAHDLETLQDEFPVTMFILLQVTDEETVLRIGGRRVCPSCHAVYHLQHRPPRRDGICDSCNGKLEQRTDDMVDRIEKRLQVYRRETAPLLGFYAQRGLVTEIDAGKTEGEVFMELCAVIGEGDNA